MKTLAALSGVSLLLAVGCGKVETKTFVASQAVVPEDDDKTASQDFNGDGEFNGDDNSLPALNTTLSLFLGDIGEVLTGAFADGTILIGVDVSAKDFTNDDKNVAVVAYLATTVGVPKLDGTDVLTVDGDTFDFGAPSIVAGNLKTGQSNFVFALPIDPANPTLLPFSNAVLTGNVSGDVFENASLSGVVSSVDLAGVLGQVTSFIDGLILTESQTANGGAEVVCAGNNTACANGQVCSSQDNTANGFCIGNASTANLLLGQTDGGLQGDKDGKIEVTFDASTKVFTVNEAALLFDNGFVDGVRVSFDVAGPGGLLGGNFRLDLDKNDVIDSMGLGIKLTGVAATR